MKLEYVLRTLPIFIARQYGQMYIAYLVIAVGSQLGRIF